MLAALSVCSPSFGQDFYDPNTIQEIKLTFFQSNWDALLDQLKQSDESAYLLAKSVEINGEVFDSVGVKYKGNSSYNASNQKNPMHIKLDYVRDGQDYHGIADVKLSNGFSDPSMIREALSYSILRKYMDAPRANFAKVWMDGTYWGVYTNPQSINKDFVRDHFYSDGENAFIKCNPAFAGGPGGGGGYPDLVYSSADSTAYYSKYELASDYGWAELLQLMLVLKNTPDSLENIMDVDRAIWMLAFNDVFVNLDSYTGAFGQNYYLYWDENDRFLPIVWDLNMSFGGFRNLGAGGGGGGSLTLAQMQQLDPLVQANNASRPLIQKILAKPTWKKRYLAHLRTMLEENFSTQDYLSDADAMQDLIDADVQADTKKFYTYDNFKKNLTQSVSGTGGPGGGTSVGIGELMNARYTYLHNNANLTLTAPDISLISHEPASPVFDETVWITAKVDNATSVELAYRFNTPRIFAKTAMFDDGNHHDGVAGDGIYGAPIVTASAKVEYYIYAENADAGRFSPERAEYEYHTFPVMALLPNPGDVVINEILADNKTGHIDENGQNEDWLELFNNTGQNINLGNLYLSDDATKPDKWQFPADANIPAKGYLVVWLDEDGSQGPLHASFKLKASGEFVMLSDGAAQVLDSISFGQQDADRSFGRYVNGTGTFVFMPTTFGAENKLTSAVHEQEDTGLALFPNPANESLMISNVGAAPLERIEVYNAQGQMVINRPDLISSVASIDVSSLAPGIYIAKIGEKRSKSFAVQH